VGACRLPHSSPRSHVQVTWLTALMRVVCTTLGREGYHKSNPGQGTTQGREGQGGANPGQENNPGQGREPWAGKGITKARNPARQKRRRSGPGHVGASPCR